ncbi:hypothetical protein BOH66_16065 [Microbacterium aurum]|uniref:Haloacid dehalogenase n=1 Tax=Microbacterium aurum TaxID=36805 RepID=A0A1P8UBZ0_9MICO|nr:hypothetical protein BOH66_16065 [Microbacterium aurum]MBM7826292.1 hypothetical protein [Microbacterium aurum]
MDNRAAVSAPQIDGVVFDCDGVLVDSESLSTQVTQKIVADLGWHVELDVLGDLLTGCSHEFYVEQVEKNIGRTLEPGWDDPYRGWLERALRAELTAVPGIHRAVADIDLRTAVASNSRHEHALARCLCNLLSGLAQIPRKFVRDVLRSALVTLLELLLEDVHERFELFLRQEKIVRGERGAHQLLELADLNLDGRQCARNETEGDAAVVGPDGLLCQCVRDT